MNVWLHHAHGSTCIMLMVLHVSCSRFYMYHAHGSTCIMLMVLHVSCSWFYMYHVHVCSTGRLHTYVANIDTHFATHRCTSVILRSRQIIQEEIHETSEVCTKFWCEGLIVVSFWFTCPPVWLWQASLQIAWPCNLFLCGRTSGHGLVIGILRKLCHFRDTSRAAAWLDTDTEMRIRMRSSDFASNVSSSI